MSDLFDKVNGHLEDHPRRKRWRERFWLLGDFAKEPFPASEPIVGEFVRRGQRTLIAGHSGQGKSTFGMSMMRSVVDGTKFCDRWDAKKGKVLVIDLEQDGSVIQRRIQESWFPGTWKRGLESRLGSLMKNYAEQESMGIVQIPEGVGLEEEDGPDQQGFIEVIERVQPDVVFLDPLFKSFQGHVTDFEYVAKVTAFLDKIRSQYEFGLVVPVHVRKPVNGAAIKQPELTEVSGIGEIVYGAEIILSIHRADPTKNFSKLRILKDRNGDLTPGDEINLNLSPNEGWIATSHRSSKTISDRIWDQFPVRKEDARSALEMAAAVGIDAANVREFIHRRRKQYFNIKHYKDPDDKRTYLYWVEEVPEVGADAITTQAELLDGVLAEAKRQRPRDSG